MRETGSIGLFYAADEIRKLVLDEVQGKGYLRRPDGPWQEAQPMIGPGAVRPGFRHRAAWHIGKVLVRGGQWLQKRFCAEPACA